VAYPKDKERWPLAGESLVAGPESSPGTGVPLSGIGGATPLWEGLTPSEKKGPEALRDHRNAAAGKALYDWSSNNPIGDRARQFLEGLVKKDDDDYLDKDRDRFKGQYDHDRINQIAGGGGHPVNQKEPWSQEDTNNAHGWLKQLQEGDQGNWQLIEQTPSFELIYEDLDTGQKVSVEQSSGEHVWHDPEEEAYSTEDVDPDPEKVGLEKDTGDTGDTGL